MSGLTRKGRTNIRRYSPSGLAIVLSDYKGVIPMKNIKQGMHVGAGIWRSSIKTRRLILILIDLAMCSAVGLVSSLMYNQSETLGNRMLGLGVLLTCILAFRFAFGVYRQVWRYATSLEYMNVVWADMAAGIVYLAVSRLFLRGHMQIMFWQALSVLSVGCLATLSARFVYQNIHRAAKNHHSESGTKQRFGIKRIVEWARKLPVFIVKQNAKPHAGLKPSAGPAVQKSEPLPPQNKINVAIVGAGICGVMLARELLFSKTSHYQPYCFIDIDSQKIGNVIAGVRVYPENGIIKRLQKIPVQEIIIALPDLSGDDKQRLFDFYGHSNCKVKLYDFPFGSSGSKVSKRILREFSIEDLLSRKVVSFDESEVVDTFCNKTILITGGGGSIGSELCRQLAKLRPDELVIFDIYENSVYAIEQELVSGYGSSIKISVEIGSVRDTERLDEVFKAHRPQIVFHAAAHKHVPLMEHSCGEAIKNNVFGTLNTVNMAERYGVERFLLVSTDKAVNPTNVMGASKRLCEMIIQSKKNSRTLFMAVRFGNVLGSNGSVVPLFKKQIASGGSITLTDKRIIRYFMTIPEAAQLLLQACAMAASGEIYVLNMGRPVKILNLAEKMIRMSGLTPYIDVDIHEIGLRPGEKIYEELLMKSDKLIETRNGMIFIEREEAMDEAQLQQKLDLLQYSLSCHTQEAVMDAMRQTVPTYQSAEKANRDHGCEEDRVQYEVPFANTVHSYSSTN